MNLPAKVEHAVSLFNNEEKELIKATVCKGATDLELRLFLADCQHRGLNPLARQIYSVQRREKRGDQWVTTRSTQVSIDGFRLIAERSGQYAGQLGPEWCAADGVWCDVWLASEPPAAARVAVLRKDFEKPCWAVARFDAYAQKTKDGYTRMWSTMGDLMIAKCAEALALRKAFPQELSGLYTSDEMMQAAEDHAAPAKPQLSLAQELNDEIPNFDSAGDAEPAAPAPQSPQPQTGAAVDILTMAREAARRGADVFNRFYKARSAADKKKINAIGDELRGLMDSAAKPE